MRLFIFLGISILLISTTGCTDLNRQLEIDNCLDNGGNWNYDINKCDYQSEEPLQTNNHDAVINTIFSRFKPPVGFIRTTEEENSFQSYLRNLKLKPEGAFVTLYNGSIKPNANVYCAVVDLDIGNKDLHQCADALMRLRAEFLWRTEQYNRIHFNFTNGFKVEYKEWMKGRRMIINGNKTHWDNQHDPSNTYSDFWEYMELIFMYAGTASLQKELMPISTDEANIGDVLIQGGFPGHAVIIVDKALNPQTNESLYMLAQSYMPAQEIQILVNPNDANLSPWIDLSPSVINTPEWTFSNNDLKRFQN